MVYFRGVKGAYITNMPIRRTGLKYLDKVRVLTGNPSIEAVDVTEYVDKDIRTVEVIMVAEDYARRSGRFVDRNEVEVVLPCQFLNKFLREEYVYNEFITTPHDFIYKLDVDALLKAWEDENFPLQWEDK